MAYPKILQIIPATGWSAMFLQEPGDSDGPLFTVPLACWAMVEDEKGYTRVKGLCGWDCVDYCDAVDTFYGYLGPGVNLKDYHDPARAEHERRQHRAAQRHMPRSSPQAEAPLERASDAVGTDDRDASN